MTPQCKIFFPLFFSFVCTYSIIIDELNYPTSISLPAIQIDNEKPDPPIGVQLIEFSPDGSYLATKNGFNLFFKKNQFSNKRKRKRKRLNK